MTRQELPNNTPEQVREYLVAALALVESLAIPIHLEAVALEQAIGLFAGKQIIMAQPQPINLGGLDLSGRRH